MHVFWANHRKAIVIFAAICVGVVVFPAMVSTAAERYASRPVVIPVWVRTLILMGALVRRFSLPIVFTSAIALFGISSASARSQR
jgi:hypothetical protein